MEGNIDIIETLMPINYHLGWIVKRSKRRLLLVLMKRQLLSVMVNWCILLTHIPISGNLYYIIMFVILARSSNSVCT